MVALIGVLLLPNVAASADPAKEAFNKGKACYEKKDYDAAIIAFSEAIRLNPRNAEAYCNRGVVYCDRGEHDRAIADCTEAIQLDSKYPDGYYERGVAYGCKGEHGKSRRYRPVWPRIDRRAG